MGDFLSMGGYGIYVWPAYGFSLVGLFSLAFAIWRRGRTLRARLKGLGDAVAKGKDA